MPGERERRRVFELAAFAVLASVGCSEESAVYVPDGRLCDATVPRYAQPLSEVSFALEQPACLALEIPEADFEQLRASNRFDEPDPLRTVLRHITTDCTTPFASDYQWYEASLRIEGQQFERVGLRKKGFLGSVVEEGLLKPSFKIKTDRFVSGQRIGDTERLTLNNGAQDPSRMRDCLAYGIFAAAGYPAPRCNLANVVVNGVPRGSYAHLEPLKKRFLRRAFGNDSGSFYEGTLSDFTEQFLAEAPLGNLGRWQPKTDETDASGKPLQAVLSALAAPDEQLLEALQPVINLERFFQFWALEALVDHADGYTGNRNNFALYFDPADEGRGTFIPWGMDAVLRDGNSDDETVFPRDLSTYVFAELPRRLSRLDEGRRRFVEQMRTLLDTVWVEETLIERISLYEQQVRSAQSDPQYEAAVQRVRRWVRGRRERMEQFLVEGLPSGAASTSSCFIIALDDGLGLLHDASQLLDSYAFTW